MDVNETRHLTAALGRQLGEGERQRDRVGATRHRDHDAVSAREQPAAANRRSETLGEGGQDWCRCRDLNPGHCGYEPHALTTELHRRYGDHIKLAMEIGDLEI